MRTACAAAAYSAGKFSAPARRKTVFLMLALESTAFARMTRPPLATIPHATLPPALSSTRILSTRTFLRSSTPFLAQLGRHLLDQQVRAARGRCRPRSP